MPFFDIDVFSLLATIFWVWMLVDCLFNSRSRGGNKLFWFLFILFTHFFGAIIYYLMKCTRRNPVDAFPYYLRALQQAVQPTRQTPPPYQYPPRSQSSSQPQQQPAQPMASTYDDYAQGYRYQPPEPVEQIQPYEARTADTPEPEYEQTMISYPEMPPQQQ
ncbi:MAG TPA: PLD nuclease N-terminal domain-containing protein [Ktedonobacteraceae bacterium]|nr:PLD nuclease N-terminal domain-containing protein [Ktedonobacteraceae bacterium]